LPAFNPIRPEIRIPSRQGRLFPPCRRNPVISLSVRDGLFRRPVELGSVDPHAVENDRELARNSDLGLAEPISPSAASANTDPKDIYATFTSCKTIVMQTLHISPPS
jgi:hypothetical protein